MRAARRDETMTNALSKKRSRTARPGAIDAPTSARTPPARGAAEMTSRDWRPHRLLQLGLTAAALLLLGSPAVASAQVTVNLRSSSAPVSGYLNLNNAKGAAAVLSTTTTTAGGTRINWTATAGGSALAWISPPLTAAYSFNAAATCNVWARESANAVNSTVRCEIGRYTTAEQTAHCTGSLATEISNAMAVRNWTCTNTTTSYAAGDRVVVRIFAANFGTMTAGNQTGNYDAPAAATGDSYVTLPGAPSFQTTTVADGSNPSVVTIAPGAAATNLDAFTLATNNGTDTVASITVTFAAGTAQALSLAEITDSTGTPLASIANPGDTATFSLGTPLNVTTTPATYFVRITPKSYAAMPASNAYAVTGTVTDFVSGNSYLEALNDAASATVTVDHAPPGTISGLAGAAGDQQVAVSWTGEPTDLDFVTGGEVVVVGKPGAAPTETPADGTDYAGGETIGAAGAFVACVAAPGARSCTTSGLTNGTSYYFVAYARDVRLNYSAGSTAAGPIAPASPNSTQLVTGATFTGGTVCPGATAVYADQFGFTVVGVADRVSSLTVSGLGVTTPIASIKVADDTGAVISSAAPTGDAQSFTFTAPNLAAPIGTTSYRLYFDVKGHAALAAGNSTVTPIVTSYVSTNTQTAGSDAANSFTIDNTAQANVGASSAGSPTATSLTLGLGASAGLTEYVVYARRGSAPIDVPADGTQYVAGTPDLANSWVAYVGTSTAPVISGLASSSTYSFAVFARDACFNYSTVAATASGATSAATQSITVGNGTGVAAATIAPGATAWTPVDSFSVVITSGGPGNTLTSVTYTSMAGMSQYLAGVRLVRASDSAVLSTVTAPSGDTWAFTGLTEAISTTAAQYRLEVQPKAHSAMPAISGDLVLAPGSAGAGVVTALGTSTGATVTYADGNAPDPASGQVLIDNQSPADPTTVAATGGPGNAHLSWANPGDADFQKVVVLAKPGSTFLASERPAEGDDPALNATYGGATVQYLGTSSPQAIGGLAGGTWYFKVFSRDTSGNFSAGVQTSAVVSNFLADGDAAPGSVKPVASIVNPMRGGVVAAPFRLQARIFSPKTSGGAAQPITGVTLLVDEVASVFTMSPIAAYGTTTESGIWGTTVSTLATGSHTLRVTATNASGMVYSGTVTVNVVGASTGDGNLLVRDNASQLCSDCHAMQTHSAEATGNKWGSWAVTCRECHTPHDTTNIELVRTKITPPAVAGQTTEQSVVFLNKTGYAAGSYASPSNNGPCQVCHTRTDYYRSTGPGPGGAHETGDCGTCHVHNKGLAAACTNCHGTEGRASIAGADPRQSAAPPAVAAGSVSVTGGGAHVAHVNKATWRTNPLPCAACHPAPHATKGATDLQWSTLATGNGAILDANMNPPAGMLGSAWPTAPSCTNWCHGGGMPGGGGSLTSPAWNGPSTSAQCGTCHASPPPVGGGAGRDHPQNVACAACHGGDYAQGGIGTTSKGTHVDGTIQKPNNGCTACHGKLAGPAPAIAVGSTSPTAAPGYDVLSVDTQGNTSTTVPLPIGVGAHGYHVNAGMMSAKTCNVCHPLPADLDTSHANGSVQMAWSAPATSGGVTPGYTRPNCTNYCHSSGDPLGAATPTTVSISWTSTTAMACSSCHASTSIATNAHGKHVPKYLCSECHVGTTQDGSTIVVGGGSHVNGTNDVSFDASSMFVQGGGYTPPTSPTNPATCSNVYCHSSGTKRAPPYTSGPSIAWNGGATTCTSCHGGPVGSASQIATGKHNNHVNVSAVIGGAASTNMTCGTCHRDTVAAGTNAPVTGSVHVDRLASVTFDTLYGGSFAQGTTEGTGSCSLNYCHSSGQDPAAMPAIIQYLNPAWNDAALGCDGCHGRAGGTGNGTGAPNYGNGGGGTPTANSHTAHVSSAADCEHCHAGTVTSAGTAILATSTLHLNKARDVQILAAYDTNSAAPNYDTASKTCNSVSCHGGGTPTWGGPKPKCSECHAGAADTDSFAFGTPGVVSTSEWTSVGHGQSTFGVNTFPTLAAGTPCLYCHDDGVLHDQTGNPFRLRGATGTNGVVTAGNYSAATASSANQVCLNCHAVTGSNGVDLPDGGALGTNPLLTSTKKVDAYHAGSKHTGAANGGTRCWDCHDPHGDGTNVKMVGSKVVKASTDNHSWAATRVTGVTFTANATGTDYAGTGTKICNACHASTLYYLANGTGNQTHQSGARCVACHVHEQAPDLAFKQSTACNACHSSPPTVGNHAKHIEAIQAAPVYGSTTIGSTGTTYGYQCGVCHTTVAANHVNDIGGTAVDPYNVNVAFSIGAVTTYTQGATATTETGPTGLVFKGTNGTCGTVYCHDPLGATYTGTNVNWTQAPGSLGCTACHPMGGAATTLLTNRHDKHVNLSPAGYAYTCERCHSTTTTTGNSITNTAQHAVGTHKVAFNSNPVNQTAGSYTIGSNGACGSTYCHSNGQSATAPFGAPNVALAWNAAAGTATCSSCHGGATGTIIASGSHTQHLNVTANPVIGTAYHCDDCHATTAAGGATPTVNVAGGLHVNGLKDGSIPARNGMVSTFGTTCSSVYCHSSGRPATAGSTAASKYASVTWGQAGTLDCKGCHGTYTAADGAAFGWASLYGEPNYANTSAGAVDANSHYKHVQAGATTCAICHQQTTTTGTAIASSSTLHADGFRDVTWDATRQTAGATYNTTNKTCGSTGASCHGAKTPQWGATLTCAGCHGTEPRAKDASVGGTVDANLIGAPPTGLGGETATTTRAVGAHISHTNQGTFRVDAITCADCHAGATHNGTKQVAFGTLGTTGGVTPNWTGTGCSLTYCHGNFKNGNDQITPVIPGAPGALSFSAVSDTGLTVSWGAVSGATVYKVERAPDVSGAPGTFVQIGTATATSYTDGGLWAATRYWYRVRGWSSLGDGAYSGSADARTTGGVVGAFTAADFDMVGEDSGTVVDGAPTNITTTMTAAVATTTVDNRNIATVNYTFANTTQRRLRPAAAISSGTYYFVDIFSPALTAADSVIAASATVSIDTLVSTAGTANPAYWTVTLFEYTSGGASTSMGSCQASYNSTSTTRQTSTCTLSNPQWTAQIGSRLKLRIQQNPTANFGRTGLLWGATTGTTAGQTWFRASRASLTPPTPPAAPAGTPVLTMGVSTQTTIAMSWTGVTGATSYKVERSPNGTTGWVQVGQPAALSFTDSALTASTTYFYRVRASNAGGDAPSYSSPVQQKQTAALVANMTAWTGTFTPGSTSLTCTSCHGDPPGGTHPAVTDCNLCHPGYSSNSVVKATHINGTVEKATDCTVCHSVQLGARRPIVSEFAMTWSHKRSGGGTVTNYDCIVCHMEGDPATGLPTDGGAHMNGVLNLRDPDTGANIKGVTFSVALGGTTAGAYSSTASDAAPTAFSRNLSSATIEPDVAAIQVNLCLKCHDSNGATAFLASNPNAGGAQGALYPMRAQGGTRTAEKPFGTSISYASIPAADGGTTTVPSGAQTAGGVAGGVIDLATSFLTTNSSYHPVSGRNDNSYAYNTRMASPWNATWTPARTAGSVNNFGYLISCWDCHAENGTASTATLTGTVTAHGGATTLRGTPTPPNLAAQSSATNQATLCKICHAQYDTTSTNAHGSGSAMNTAGQSPMNAYMQYGCNMCHGSGYGSVIAGAVPVIRPVRAQDVHGVDALPTGGLAKSNRWLGSSIGTPAQVNARPYAFIRNTFVLTDHTPLKIGGTTYTTNCNMAANPCQQGTRTYSPAGTF